MKMKLLFITNGVHGSGGLERVLATKTNSLIDQFDYDITILTINGENDLFFFKFHPKVKFLNIILTGNVFFHFLSYVYQIKKAINLVNPDIISVCDDGLKGLFFPILFTKSTPLIYERHASLSLNFNIESSFFKKIKNKIINKAIIFGAKKFNKFIVLTSGNKNDWPEVLCTVIPNPNPYQNRSSLIYKKEKKVIAVGTQSYNKGYDRLIKIWSIVNNEFPDWVLNIYGKKNDNLNLIQEVERLNLEKIILFHDPIKDIHLQYQKASILALSSRSEGFGMVLIEAMSFGVPCVSFDCLHGPSDIINDGEDGYLIEDGNINAFAIQLIKLIKSQELRSKMSRGALKNVKKYSSDRIILMWDDLYKNLLKYSNG